MSNEQLFRGRRATGIALFVGAALAGLACWAVWPTAGSRAATAPVTVFPIPNGHVAAPRTQLTFRGVPASQLGSITVTGSSSGLHTGRIVGDSDGQGGSFVPSTPFKPGERVTVRTSLNVVGGLGGAYGFNVAVPAGRIPAAKPILAPRTRGDVMRFVTRGFAPSTVKVNKLPSRAQAGGLFVGTQEGPVQNGAMILGPYGGLVWFQPAPRNGSITDFRVQSYRSQRVLTWWQGNVNGGVGQGVDEIYDNSYRQVATVRAGNSLIADLHEFQLTPQNTALITAYYPVIWDASSVKGSKQQVVVDSVVQEIDIPTGLVLYQWDSLDHVALTDGFAGKPKRAHTPYDYFHINSIQQDTDGNLVISARNTWTIYSVSHQTAAVIWRLGGKHSTFKMGKNTTFAFQHDARMRSSSEITLFDDGAGPPVVHKQSRGLTLRLDTTHMTASVLRQVEHRPSLLAAFEGNLQVQPNGDQLVGWGQQPYFTEFNSAGKTVFDAHFVGPNSTYRAYRFDWHATPARPPDVAARVKGRTATVYASWNGATQVVSWRVLGGSTQSSLKPLTSARKRVFETAIRLPRATTFVEAQALDSKGRVIGTSAAVKVP